MAWVSGRSTRVDRGAADACDGCGDFLLLLPAPAAALRRRREEEEEASGSSLRDKEDSSSILTLEGFWTKRTKEQT